SKNALPISELFSIHCSLDKRLAPRSNSFLLKKSIFFQYRTILSITTLSEVICVGIGIVTRKFRVFGYGYGYGYPKNSGFGCGYWFGGFYPYPPKT
ncbi:hypothetical protein BpHYR1_052397, partial [Brachionus plicatilis]